MKGIWFSVWAACCIALGLLLAYADGVRAQGIIGSAIGISLLIIGALTTTYISRALKRRRSAKH